jgi:putative hydrolase
VTPAEALDRIAELLDRDGAPAFKARAFRDAAVTVRELAPDELRQLAAAGRLRSLRGVGARTEEIILEALAGRVPAYLADLEGAGGPQPATSESAALRMKLRGDCHSHTDWSDGGQTIEAMAAAARELGMEYLVVTDHSPRLTVANGLSAERLREQLDQIEALNSRLAPFRILTGCEVDILEDGSLDQDPELLSRVDVVVASVHSRFGMDRDTMTRRLVTAIANPHTDILGHPTGRRIVGRNPRPEYSFDHEMVFTAAARFDKAIEINCRPERLDPPRRLLRLAEEIGCRFAIDTDAHATGQLTWHVFGCDRASEAGLDPDEIVNTWSADELVEWCGSHE